MIALYTATIFVSAVLLFSVQPMVGKMILPLLGGTPAVWNLCMLFFQAALLAGYAYAHGSVARLGVRRQAIVHLLILATPLLVLPIAIADNGNPPADGSPVLWLLGRLTLAVGLPFVVVSTSAPLLQRWFASTGHRAADDPYFLYAASNGGSLLALLSFPLVIEPMLTLDAQARLWSWGYRVLLALLLACAVVVWRTTRHANPDPSRDPDGDRRGSPMGAVDHAGAGLAETASPGGDYDRPRRADAHAPGLLAFGVPPRAALRWVALAFVPSSLMLGVTAHITTDIAAVPLFWVVPLALYLMTFVLVFARKPLIPQRWMSLAMPYLLIPVALLIYSNLRVSSWLIIPIHLAAFFVAAMVCHQELARSRPAARYLTGFYLLMSVGGVLGGVFNALVAPLVFDTVVEYPLVMAMACLFRPTPRPTPPGVRTARMDFLAPTGLVALCAVTVLLRNAAGLSQSQLGLALVYGIPAMVCFGFKERPVRFALGFAVLLVTTAQFARPDSGAVLDIHRNFFGVKKVVLDADGRFRRLYHGSTTHGMQSTDPATSDIPLSYYHPTGPIGDVFAMIQDRPIRTRVGIIGLGTGAIAAYAGPGDHYTFFEIDPAVDRIARDPRYFTFLERCRGDYDVVLGDGRLALGGLPDGTFGLVILDAFSSDAVPTHLLSKQALAIYVAKTQSAGLIAFHISNRHLNFEPMLAQLAREAGLACLARADIRLTPEARRAGKRASHWLVMARDERLIAPLTDSHQWYRPSIPPHTPTWTDQYCNVLSLFTRGSRTDRE